MLFSFRFFEILCKGCQSIVNVVIFVPGLVHMLYVNNNK